MYEILKKNESPLTKENIFYEGDTSEIYRVGEFLYKVYLKKEPHKREILDYLIEKYDLLRPYSIPPINKLKIEEKYGMKMRYVESTDFLSYLRAGVEPDEMVRIIRTLSDNLKPINELSIHFSDLHHHNILILKDGYPLYIDLDDASIKEYGSTHICVMAHRLHKVENKSYQYEDDLIRYGNLDQECLVLMLLNYMFDSSLELLTYSEFNRKLEKISPYFENEFMTAISKIKDSDDNIIVNPYPYYIGDYMSGENFIESVQKVKRRCVNENSCISSNQ